MKVTKFLLIILFFILPLIHGRILPTLGLDLFFSVFENFEFIKAIFFNLFPSHILQTLWYNQYFAISGNFEFTKAIFFNLFSSLIFLTFFIENIVVSFLFQRKEFRMDSSYIVLGAILLILILSTILSTSPFMSLIGDTEKGHTALMFFNLLGLFVVLKNLDKKFFKTLIYTSLLAGFFVSLLSIKELNFPSFNYQQLAGRALGSFGHPNYLAGYLLLLLPFCNPFGPPPSFVGKKKIQNKIIKGVCFSILLAGIIFSKSIIAIVLALGYIALCFLFPLIKRDRSMYEIGGIVLMLILGVGLYIIIKYYPAKLHSFLSRFYIWETTLKIIASDPKIIFIGAGAETLPYYFDSFKVPQVYIFENYGFTADRPHNFILNIFYHFGVFALGIFFYLVYNFFLSLLKSEQPKAQELSAEKIAIILFLLFGIIHFFSIASYALVVLVIASSFPCKEKGCKESGDDGQKAIYLLITLISLTGAYYSFRLYQSEVLLRQKGPVQANTNFMHPKYLIEIGDYSNAQTLELLASQKNIKSQISSSSDKQTLCNTLTQTYGSAENYFHCGNLFWKLGKQEIAQQYYNAGLKKLPDLWEQDSPYWENYFIKNSITGNRFFAPKFGDIRSVLEKVGK